MYTGRYCTQTCNVLRQNCTDWIIIKKGGKLWIFASSDIFCNYIHMQNPCHIQGRDFVMNSQSEVDVYGQFCLFDMYDNGGNASLQFPHLSTNPSSIRLLPKVFGKRRRKGLLVFPRWDLPLSQFKGTSTTHLLESLEINSTSYPSGTLKRYL